MAATRILIAILGTVILAGCGSRSSASTLDQLCGKYAGAAAQLVPQHTPAPVPKDFAARLKVQANQTCVQHAV
jgi:hypothetical protein